MAETTEDQKIPNEIAESVANTVFSYGKIKDLTEQEMLSLSDALAPYYPLSDEENTAALALRESLAAQDLRQAVEKPLRDLSDVATKAVDAWGHMMDRWNYERRERSERRYYEERHHEERHSEMHPDHLYKELHHQLQSGDPRAMMHAMERLIDEAIRRNQPAVPNIPTPSVAIPPELVAATKELSEQTEERLATFVDRRAKAKQCLASYIFHIVATEKIKPTKD